MGQLLQRSAAQHAALRESKAASTSATRKRKRDSDSELDGSLTGKSGFRVALAGAASRVCVSGLSLLLAPKQRNSFEAPGFEAVLHSRAPSAAAEAMIRQHALPCSLSVLCPATAAVPLAPEGFTQGFAVRWPLTPEYVAKELLPLLATEILPRCDDLRRLFAEVSVPFGFRS
jgi:hypothetical protein